MSKRHSRRKLSMREYLMAIWHVAQEAYRAAPLAVFIKLFGSVITAVLPIITTYFAALTTTELGRAYVGDKSAGNLAVEYVIVTAALGVAGLIWGSLENYFNQLTKYRIDAAISDHMYGHFLSLDFWRYDDKDTADAFDKSKQFAQFFGYIFDRVADIITQIITMLAGLVALALVSPWLGVILLVAIIPSLIIQIRLSRLESAHWRETIETRRAKDIIEWNLFEPHHIAELRLYAMASYLMKLRRDLREKDEKHRLGFEKQFILKRLGTQVLEAIAEIIALVYTASQIVARQQPIGQFLYVQQVVSRALGGVRGLITGLSSVSREMANLFDYRVFMELPEGGSGSRKLKAVPEAIAAEHISFRYPNSERMILHDVSLTVKKGQHVALVGENGAGKSTLIKILTGLYHPTKGSVTLDGINLNEFELNSWHKHLSVLQQQYLAYGFATAHDNIRFGDIVHPFDEQRFAGALKKAQAGSFLRKLPKGLDTYLNPWMEHEDETTGVDLSGGQWQRVALARAFYRNSPIIILDEPTSAIDALAESKIFDYLFQDRQKTIITISHRLTTVKKADVIYMLEDGRVVEQGTHDELVARKGPYFRMFESQL